MNLGIIGAENSHTAAIAQLLNVDKVVRGFSVTHVWGETRHFARAAAEAGRIPTIVKDPTEMLGAVDCVMVDHRHGKHHLKVARPFIAAGIPVFVDKPMSTSLAEARAFLRFRAAKKVAVTTASVLPHQASVKQIRRQLGRLGTLRAVHLHGPGSHKSPYGGIWFYGIHLVDLMVELFGAEPRHAQMVVNDQCSMAVCTYDSDLTVTMGFLAPERHPFTLSAVGTKGDFHAPITYDPNPYLGAAKLFTRMFRTGIEPFGDRRMLAPLAVLDALGRSLARKTRVKISAVP